MKSFLKFHHNLQFHWRRAPSQLFSNTFEKIFQNTVLCQKTGKATEGTEVFVRICFSKKLIWRISPNSSKRNYDGFSLVKKQPATLFRKDSITAVFLCHRGNKSMFKIHSSNVQNFHQLVNSLKCII